LSLAADVRAFFSGVAQIISTIADYEWLAISVNSDAGKSLCVHTHPSRHEHDLERAMVALGLAGESIEPWLVCDERCQRSRGPGSSHETYPISLAGVELGRLAVGSDPRIDANEIGIFAFVTGELAAPLRSVVLTEAARRLAMTDALTGLSNRRCAADPLDRFFAAATRYGSDLSVSLLDIDLFKRINDGHGHDVGDQALRQVAGVLMSKARASDVVARWGGEEFLHIMPSTGAAGARIAAERMRMAIMATPLVLADGSKLDLSASFGVATLEAGDDQPKLLERADQALYRAKERGRNRVEVADGPRQSTAGRL
jgi:diguanylate cyclase (GGDEF)-like protein